MKVEFLLYIVASQDPSPGLRVTASLLFGEIKQEASR
jgi:hypothetical protein